MHNQSDMSNAGQDVDNAITVQGMQGYRFDTTGAQSNTESVTV